MVRIRMHSPRPQEPSFLSHRRDRECVRRNGVVIEQLGWYNPLEKNEAKQIEIDVDRVKHWISMGAQPSDTVRDMLAKRDLVNKKDWEADRAEDRKKVEVKVAAAKAAEGEKKEEPKKS